MRAPRLCYEMDEGMRTVAYLYAIRCGEFTKLGIATSIERRMKEMALHNPYPLELILYRSVSWNTIHAVEKRVHELLGDKRHAREWFTVALPEIRRAVKQAIAEAQKVERVERRMLHEVRIVASEALARGLDVEKEIRRAKTLTKQALQR